MRFLRWRPSASGVLLALFVAGGLAAAVIAPTACAQSDSDDDGGDDGFDDQDVVVLGDDSPAGPDDAAEPLICTQFTAAGSPCPTASPVLCFQECEAGGCTCRAMPGGPRWVCVTDLSCVPDCAPVDDGCSTAPSEDGGAADGSQPG